MAASLWWDEPEEPNTTDTQKRNEELLVFGYACKLFRDDNRARAIENGKLLIPWMGDERLMIDRYDGRGHLYDLASHDADSVEDKNPVLTEEEAAIEKACDEERYLELHTDMQEAQLYEEEEWKRYYLSLQEGYQAVGFSYDQQSGGLDGLQQDVTEATKEEEKPFIVPVELHVPADTKTPTCIKHNARIEKTASFIAQHGIQMEIMLKTKQAGNSQFDFLHFDNELNPYYKHVVSMIKSGKYKPQEEEDEDSQKDDDHGQDYLHPSLFSSASQLPPLLPPATKPIELPKVSINDTPYGALIKSIRRNTELARTSLIATQAATQVPSHDLPTPTSVPTHSKNPPPPGTEPVTLPTVASLNGPAFVEQLYSQPPPPGTEDDDSTPPVPSVKHKVIERSSSSDSSSSSSSSSSSRSSQSSGQRSKLPHRRKRVASPRVEGPSPVLLPPPDVQPIIDRMAMYVAKNGVEFEMVVMSRKDARFQFLNEYHAHYTYYKQRKDKYLQELGKTGLEIEREVQDDKLGNNSQRSVSFSIKSRPRDQDGGQPSGKARLFEYDSSEGEDKQEGEPTLEVTSGAATPTTKPQPQADEESQREIEEKLKDKLASAVKERLSHNHKEKQLQLERKRKAAAFLNLIKSSQTTMQPPAPEDLSSLYVAEEVSPNPLVFEYDNQSKPHLVLKKKKRSKSPKTKKRRRRSPTPPSAYSLDRRSPNQPSPSVWINNRPGTWSGIRDRTTSWQHRQRGRAAPSRRSHSRSPHRKVEKKKKHKRPQSKSPSRKDKNKDRLRRTQEKTKVKSKDREKKKKEKSRHKTKDREARHAQRKSSSKDVLDSEVNSDFENMDVMHVFSEEKKALRNGRNFTDLDLGGVHFSDVASVPSNSTESVPKQSKSFMYSESTGDLQVPSSRPSSRCNSPATRNSSISRGSTPSRSSVDTTSTDLMIKVRAMLKKSRELILREDGGQPVDDT